MSAGNHVFSEDQFLCSICLDVFTDPVSTPCGHNFCKTCITHHWDDTTTYKCPLCNENFLSKPNIKVNTVFRDVVAQFRRGEDHKSSSSEQQAAKPGEVPCDVCTGTKVKALKSCLVCLTSYCQTHLEPHLTTARMRKHQLIEPVENLEDRMCKKHDKPLELFCKSDQTCVCMLCPYEDHKSHDVVPLREEFEGKKAELGKTQAELQQMIQKRRLKMEELKSLVQISKASADRERAKGVQVFRALIESAHRGLEQFLQGLEDKHKRAEEQAQVFIRELEEEISKLMKRSAEAEQLSRSKDHLQLLQSFSSLKDALPTKDWTLVSIHPPSYEGTVLGAVTELELTLTEKKKKLLREAELKKVQQFAVDLTLDPDTANPFLILSDDGKQVTHRDDKKHFPDNPKRFSYYTSVLSKQSFSSGRFYFEVQVKGKTEWTLGVVRESIHRKKPYQLSPLDGLWTLALRNGEKYWACADPSAPLSLGSSPERVGVFVDYEEGLVSFYDVATAALIYSFTGCCFTEKLFPFFNPRENDSGRNSAPLVICPIRPN